ncbi:paraben-hydrolyzing esterase precursor [Lophiostoma macrostomum CBS 122681]|uniref:Paraben-hydrolyzing esterase n=1 Tax=Lophiostoma macrostomum CBS 122681 TaxID=1314788 RepID=A0A6A6T4G1_9PLEO|nr:paraben-hydrolyzing esterase precursor [Lophiostoma macrostomum CBS 122681]
MKEPSKPYLRDLSFRGFIEGLTYLDTNSKPLAHFFGGIPYALPPVGPFRWQKPRPLPACYRYGTRANPGRYTGNCSLCPQPTQENKLDDEFWDEDCLQCNIWVPTGDPPKGGWPVLFWIHGGFLQWGTARDEDLTAMLSETACKAIVVMPAYRLNVFGFLASSELYRSSSSEYSTNVGFWDQRMALEWTWQNINYFDGDASNITIAGYSAGSHSTFHQLAYDLGVPDSKAIIKRALMLSNGPGLQPKSLDEAQEQFNELLKELRIPLTTSVTEKLGRLRKLDPKTLLKATMRMDLHQFRAVTDGSFVRHDLLHEIDSGVFAQRMQRRGIKLLIGECRDEHSVYGTWRPPKNTFASLQTRLHADYPLSAVEVFLAHYCPDGKLPTNCRNWKDAFGRIYADLQVHHLERGMVNALVRHGAGALVYRYRIEWRAKCCDDWLPKEWGVTHGSDQRPIWLWGSGLALSGEEKDIIRHAFHENLARFVNGEELDWGTSHTLRIRTLKPDGSVKIEEDSRLEEGVKVWDLLKKVGATGHPTAAAKL